MVEEIENEHHKKPKFNIILYHGLMVIMLCTSFLYLLCNVIGRWGALCEFGHRESRVAPPTRKGSLAAHYVNTWSTR